MEKLKDQGKASAKAVELAAAQLVLAQTAVATATIAAAAASAGVASSSITAGFYGAGYMNTTSTGIKNTMETSLSVGSNFISNGDVDIASNNNINIIGSLFESRNGDINLSAQNNINIEAGTNTISQTSKQETIQGGGSVGNNGVQLNIGFSQGESDYYKIFYTNSEINATNGNLNLTTGNNANISGANLLAQNITLDIANNLNIESRQTEENFSSSGFGFNFGVGVGSGGNGGNVGGGFNVSNADMHRLWVDDITTIKGTESMNVNVGNDLNLTGAAILSDNMTLNVTGDINKKELQDSYYSESMSLGVSTNWTVAGSDGNANQPTIIGSGDKPNQAPGGATTIQGSYAQNESNRTVYATIGGLDSELTSQTNSMINADFEGALTVDHRLLSDEGRANITENFEELGQNLNQNPLTPMGLSILIEEYTGRELSWEPGDVARFKEKGNEFATSVIGANTIGMANVIDPITEPERLYLVGQPITSDQDYYQKKLTWANEGGVVSSTNSIPGFNSMSVFHDKFTEETFLGAQGLLQISIFPSIPINYYGLIGKSIRNLYEQPKNNLTGGAQ